jgi:HEAT repeat protein
MALVSLGGQGMDVLLKHLGNRSSQTRTDVAMTLSEHMGDPRVKAFVASALASENANLQDGARRVIARTSVATGGRETDTPKILATVWRQNVSDPQEPARRKLLALGAAATPTVLALLKDENSAVRVAAVEMLAEIGDRSAVPSLVKTLGDDSVAVRAGAVEALGRLGDPKSASALVKVIGDRNPAVGEVALNALSILDAPVATEALIGAMSSVDWRLRRAAAEGLGRRANDRAAAALIRVVEKDPQWSVRRAAADSLGRTGNIACAPALIAALGDNHWFVRYAAHQSLQALAGRESAADPDAWNTWWEQNRKRRSAQ